jgi:hypothetical protein
MDRTRDKARRLMSDARAHRAFRARKRAERERVKAEAAAIAAAAAEAAKEAKRAAHAAAQAIYKEKQRVLEAEKWYAPSISIEEAEAWIAEAEPSVGIELLRLETWANRIGLNFNTCTLTAGVKGQAQERGAFAWFYEQGMKPKDAIERTWVDAEPEIRAQAPAGEIAARALIKTVVLAAQTTWGDGDVVHSKASWLWE